MIFKEKRTRTLEAVQWNGINFDELQKFVGRHTRMLYVFPDGNVATSAPSYSSSCYLYPGDYLIKQDNDFYVQRKEDFESFYEPADENAYNDLKGENK